MDTSISPDRRIIPSLTPASPGSARVVSSDALLGDRRELLILHHGREYRLRLTQNDKLILTA